MAKYTKNVVDKHLRDMIFGDLIESADTLYLYKRINDRQYGIILTDDNNVQRYCRIGVIVAEEREDMTAEELMQSEIEAYKMKQEAKAEKAKEKEKKIAEDKARRKKEKEEKEEVSAS